MSDDSELLEKAKRAIELAEGIMSFSRGDAYERQGTQADSTPSWKSITNYSRQSLRRSAFARSRPTPRSNAPTAIAW